MTCGTTWTRILNIFIWVYFIVLILEISIRAPIDRKRRQEKVLLGLLSLAGFFLPLVYAVTNWLDFANYILPAWARWMGVLLAAGAVYVFWRGHADLGVNWSPSLEIREKHELITRGIYGVIRHPMYASQWLLVLAQPLLLQNWIAGFGNLIVFALFYSLRVKAEEAMMIDSFGEQYQDYMNKVGGVLPKLGK